MKNVARAKSFHFAKKIVQYVDSHNKPLFDPLLVQLLKSGSSIGANVEEAIGGQSRRDFVSKINIAYKEAREAKYWIKVIKVSRSETLELNELLEMADELCRILWSIINTVRKKK